MTREDKLKYQRDFMAKCASERRAAGLCVRCGAKAQDGRSECADCIYKYGAKRRNDRIAAGMCPRCGGAPAPGHVMCERDARRERSLADRRNEDRKDTRRARGLNKPEPPHTGPDVEARKRKLEALASCGGNAQKAAVLLGCSRATINKIARDAGVRADYQRRYEVFGQRFTIAELSDLGGVPKDVIKTRIKRGIMTLEEAVMRPVTKGAPF